MPGFSFVGKTLAVSMPGFSFWWKNKHASLYASFSFRREKPLQFIRIIEQNINFGSLYTRL